MESRHDHDNDNDGDPRILEAASSLWSEKGYEASTHRELSRRLGIGLEALYQRFPTKESLVQALYTATAERVKDAFVAAHDEEPSLRKRFAKLLRIKLEILAPHRAALAGICRDAAHPESTLRPWSRESGAARERSRPLFQSLDPASSSEATATILWWMHLAVLFYWIHDRSPETRNTFRLVKNVSRVAALVPRLAALAFVKSLAARLGALEKEPDRASAERSESKALEVEVPEREVDVVVIGAGPLGALYASMLKRERERTRIVVLDRDPEPGHKIGESTLSGFCKAVRSVGVRGEALEALFYPKNGLGFFHVSESVKDVTRAPEYILESFDATFQVERRVLDSLLIGNARRLGVEVIQGAKLDAAASELQASASRLVYAVGGARFALRARLVVDASGPSSVLSRKIGLAAADPPAFQCSAVWTYFDGVRTLQSRSGWTRRAQFPRDQYTQHLCFPEGWLWYIPIRSFQSSPTANLGRALDRVLDPGSPVPTRPELTERYGCPVRDIVSIGLVLRSDRDARLREDPRAAFEHYRRKYPAISNLLEGARMLADYYGTGQSFMSRLNFRSRARSFAGDGWLLVGDAAFFIDPLISPGLTGGAAGVYRAVRASIAALDAGRFTKDAFVDYERFLSALHAALERDNQLVYMSFDHPEALALIQRFQEIGARRHFLDHEAQAYSLEDTNVWGILDPAYQEIQKAAWALMREQEISVGREIPVDEQSHRDYEPMVRGLEELLGPHVSRNEALTPYLRANATIRS